MDGEMCYKDDTDEYRFLSNFVLYLSNKTKTLGCNVDSVSFKDENLESKYSIFMCSKPCLCEDNDCLLFDEIRCSISNIPYHNGIDLHNDLLISCKDDELIILKVCKGYIKGFSIKFYSNVVTISLYNSIRRYHNLFNSVAEKMVSDYKMYLLNILNNHVDDDFKKYINGKYTNIPA